MVRFNFIVLIFSGAAYFIMRYSKPANYQNEIRKLESVVRTIDKLESFL